MSDNKENIDNKGKTTDGNKRSFREKWLGIKQTKSFKVLTNNFFIATVVFLLIVVVLDSNNLIRWGGDYIEVMRQERLMKKYREDIRKVDEKLQELSSNKDSLEKFAREQYYFHQQGEEIFVVK